MSWTNERIEQLKSLWVEGLSASRIAKTLGGISRNAVIGKVHRLGLAGRACAPRGERIRVAAAAAHRQARMPVPPPPIIEEDPVVLEDGHFATVLTIRDRMCRWPIGDPSDNEFHFCGRSPKSGSPYCEAHSRKAYQPPQLRPEKRRLAG